MLSKLWFRVILGWIGSVLAVLWLPDQRTSLPVVWQYLNLDFVIASSFSVLASRQFARAGGALVFCFIYLPWSKRGTSLIHHLVILLAIVTGGVLIYQIPITGPLSFVVFIIWEIWIWQEKQKDLVDKSSHSP
ncbi:hypothetical protein [Melghirimyces algeriensis]|uniref:Uncharacterized protein n=1 Tax=Melghirimyces algeriensis TaxID=910412 RepID=A0A521B488_9BACL|nr:hypothetical protein [Melghirimyces algeriensis]SMO41885.1 hypothetical protein SAMN06264849_101539 [Melghirimyces algeriensis]